MDSLFDAEQGLLVEIAISDHQLPNLESDPKVPLLRSNYLTPPGTKDPIMHHQDSWPSGLSDQRPPGAEGPPEEKKASPSSPQLRLSLVPGDFTP